MSDTQPPWTAPERTDPALTGPERELLDNWLDYHRNTLLIKCAGLSGEQLAQRSCPPSTMSLLGLVRHMAEVERGWFGDFADGETPPLYYTDADPDGDFDNTDPAQADADVATFRAEVAAARAAVAGRALDELSPVQSRGRDVSLRWIYLHMIEEYARHNGHADLLRERIDGRVGQ
jgi:uncharacterized damage-inducible protein DinB